MTVDELLQQRKAHRPMKWNVLLTSTFFLCASTNIVIFSQEIGSCEKIVPKPTERERVILAPVDHQDARLSSPVRNHDKNEQPGQKKSRPRSPSLSDEPSKRKSPQRDSDSFKENSPSSGSSSPLGLADFLLTDAKCRKQLYNALNRNEKDSAIVFLMAMAINKLAEPELVAESYRTMRQLLPQLNRVLKDSLLASPYYFYVDILCSSPQWESPLMIIFFDELKNGQLTSSPQVLLAQYYAVKYLELTLKGLLQKLLEIMETEIPQLLTPRVSRFLNPTFVPHTFEHFFYQVISDQFDADQIATGSGVYGLSTPPLGIFEQLEHIEREGISPTKEGVHQTSVVRS